MMRLLLILPLTVARLAVEAVPICIVVTEEDARAIIGPTAKRTRYPSRRQWAGAARKGKTQDQNAQFGA